MHSDEGAARKVTLARTILNGDTLLGFAGGYMSLGTLRLLDALLLRPVSWTAMAADARELRAHGAGISRAEVQRMEADFRCAMVRPVPRWADGAGLLASENRAHSVPPCRWQTLVSHVGRVRGGDRGPASHLADRSVPNSDAEGVAEL